MGKKKDEDSIDAIKRDDRNLSIAGKRWDELVNVDDEAVIHMALIRDEVEQED